jgi:hypothetical protein
MDIGTVAALIQIGIWMFVVVRAGIQYWRNRKTLGVGQMPKPLLPQKVLIEMVIASFLLSGFSFYWSYHIAPLSPKEWMESRNHLQPVYNRNFGPDDVIELDGKNIHDCNFVSSTIIYRGKQSYYWNHNHMAGNIKVNFLDGPAFSGSTLLRTMMESYPCVPGNTGGTCTIDVIDQDGKSLGPHP